MFKKIWSDPVWSKVISAGIIALIAGVSAYFSGYVPTIISYIYIIFSFVFASSYVPNLVIFCFIVITFLFIRDFISKIKTKDPVIEQWRNYKKDSFLGLLWVWSYEEDGSPTNVHSLCPMCQCEIAPTYVQINSREWGYRYACDLCDYEVKPISGTYAEVDNKIKRMAQQKIRTGAWKSVALK